MTTTIYATGFNAFSQLNLHQPSAAETPEECPDLHIFTKGYEGPRIKTIRPFLTFTAVETETHPAPHAHNSTLQIYGSCPPTVEKLLQHCHKDDILIAQRGDGSIALTTPTPPTLHLFPTPLAALSYALNPTPSSQTSPLPSLPATLTSNTPTFTLLIPSPSPPLETAINTLGDPRYPLSLGRPTTPTSPPTAPCPIPSLQSLPTGPITKIVSSGYTTLALTSGHDLYAWGQPSTIFPPTSLSDPEGEPQPVVVTDVETGEEKDVRDMGLGEGHAVVLSVEGEVYVTGGNANGQLGVGGRKGRRKGWVRVELKGMGMKTWEKVVGVYAGERSSFIVVETAEK